MSWLARLFGNKEGADAAAAQKRAAKEQLEARKSRSKNQKQAKKDVLQNLEKPLSERIESEKIETEEKPVKKPQKSAIAEDSAVAARKKEQRKKRIKQAMAGVAILIIGYGIHLLFKPFQGDMKFGICRVFLEQQVRFPETLRLSTVQDFGESVRIWYSYIDAFGLYRLEPMECYYRADERFGAALDKVTISRREVDPDVIERFNNAIPAIFEYQPDLTLPLGFPETLNDLKFDPDAIRSPLL